MKTRNMVKNTYRANYQFIDSAVLNNDTYWDYLHRLEKIATSIFEWVNLPSSMDSRYLEKTLFFFGKATLLKDKTYGFINTRCCGGGDINIYGLPTKFECFSYGYSSKRKLYTGLDPLLSDKQKEVKEYQECILVPNNMDFLPTASTLELYAYRLYTAEQTAFINIIGQRHPIMILCDEKQRLTMMNLYNQYNGNQPFIFGDKNILNENMLKAIKTDSPYIADKIIEYKKEIWNEALSFLGINNLTIEKKERMITDEANSNNELINMNLQSYLAPRLQACKEFNEKYGLTGTDKEISVRVRSDLHNIIKENITTANDFKESKTIEEGEYYE